MDTHSCLSLSGLASATSVLRQTRSLVNRCPFAVDNTAVGVHLVKGGLLQGRCGVEIPPLTPPQSSPLHTSVRIVAPVAVLSETFAVHVMNLAHRRPLDQADRLQL